jgi:hypothetical protein
MTLFYWKENESNLGGSWEMSRIDVGLDIIKHQHNFKLVQWSNMINFQEFWGNKKWLKVNKNLQACITI